MMKTSFGFLAGVLAMAAVVYLAGARFAAPMFLAGIVAVLAPSIALLSSVSRIRSAARFLSAFADAFDRKGRAEAPAPRLVRTERADGYRRPSTKQRGQILDDTISEYLDDEVFTAPSTRRAS